VELFNWFYVWFNQAECLIWWAFGAYFVFRIFCSKPGGFLLLTEAALVAGFLFFGLSDYFEAKDDGPVPIWLWCWKIPNGIILFSLLIWRDYLLRGRVALRPWRFVAASLILTLAIYQVAHEAGGI